MKRKVIHFVVSKKEKEDPRQNISKQIKDLEETGIVIPDIDSGISESSREKIIRTTWSILFSEQKENTLEISQEELINFQKKWIGKSVTKAPYYDQSPNGICIYAGINEVIDEISRKKVVKWLLWVRSFIHTGNAIPGINPEKFKIITTEEDS